MQSGLSPKVKAVVYHMEATTNMCFAFSVHRCAYICATSCCEQACKVQVYT